MINVDTLSHAPDGPIFEEARSRQSYVSHRSNTDMKGENLVKFSPKNKDQESALKSPTNDHNKLLESKETNKLLMNSNESSAPDKQLGSIGENQSWVNTPPPRTAGNDEDEENMN